MTRAGGPRAALLGRAAALLRCAVASSAVAWSAVAGGALAREPSPAPPLPPPAGAVVEVASVPGLLAAASRLESGTTILLAKGTYDLTAPVVIGFGGAGLRDVAIRGATGDPDDVVLRGRGMDERAVSHGILVGEVDGVLIADLTIRDVFHHGIQLAGERGCRAPRIYHCRIVDAGEQLVKGSVATPGEGVDQGVVEHTVFEYTDAARGSYTNGLDILGGAGWVVRHNLFRRIRSRPEAPLAGAAVLFWRRSRDTACYGNRFEDCDQGIAFGLERDPAEGEHDHRGGVIRNNVFYRSGRRGDGCIDVRDSPGTKILHNTVRVESLYPNAIEVRFAGSSEVEVRYNLVNRSIARLGGASAEVADNLVGVHDTAFIDAARGDLRLASSARSALDKASPHPLVADDFSGATRPAGPRDLGAYEAPEPAGPGDGPSRSSGGCGGCGAVAAPSAGAGAGSDAGGGVSAAAAVALAALARYARRTARHSARPTPNSTR